MVWINVSTYLWAFPKASKTAKGHMKQQKQNARSAQQNKKTGDVTPPMINKRTHNVFATFVNYRAEVSTDATGPFPVIYILGNKYALVLYNYDTNYIMF